MSKATYDALMGHQRAHGRDLGNGTHTAVCTCGLVVVLDWKLDAKSWFVGHQAQMLADAGLVASETEWGVRYERQADPTMDNPGGVVTVVQTVATEAIMRAAIHNRVPLSARNRRPVRREVTAWRPADE